MDALAKLARKLRFTPAEVKAIAAALERCEKAGGDWEAELRASGKRRWTSAEVLAAADAAVAKACGGRN